MPLLAKMLMLMNFLTLFLKTNFIRMKKLLLLTIPVLSIFASCGGSSDEEYTKSPSDDIVRDLYQEDNFSIILHDMDVDDSGMFNKYKHKYRIVREKDTMLLAIDTAQAALNSGYVPDEDSKLVSSKIPYDSITGWVQVSEKYFKAQQDNMGMNVVTKKDGELSKVASPPGYSNYVGRRQYGYWGGGMCHFYGQYMFMSTMFGMHSRPVYYGGYSSYRTSYASGRPYYGSSRSGAKTYGTSSAYNKTKNPSYFSRRQSKTGWTRSNATTRSTRAKSSGSSRYGGSSSRSYRSSGGGFGK